MNASLVIILIVYKIKCYSLSLDRCVKSKFNHGPKVMFALRHAASDFNNFGTDSTGPLTESYSVDTVGAFSTKLRVTQKRKILDQSARLADCRHRQEEESRARKGEQTGCSKYWIWSGNGPGWPMALKFLHLLFKQTSEESVC